MNNLKIALRNTFRKSGNNIIKILSLAVGLTVGLVLIAKIVFELSYDNFYPDNNRIYQIHSTYGHEDSELEPYDMTSGAVAWGMKNEIPEVEISTRFTFNGSSIYTEARDFLTAEVILADENLFDVLSRPILIGDAHEILSLPMQCLVSKSIAEKIGIDNVVGQTITLSGWPDLPVTISGVYEDIPENASYSYDVVISLKSIGYFTWDGTENWLGNDRYFSFVKLAKGVKPESLEGQIKIMQEKYQDMEVLQKAGVTIGYYLVKLTDVNKSHSMTKILVLVFGLLAGILLITSILNYTLIVISSLVNRSKEIAVYKCYGASGMNITKLMFTETFIHLLTALLLSAGAIYLFKNTIERLLTTSLHALFAPQIIIILILICFIIFFISGLVPSRLFSKVPVAAAFRRAKESHRRWKVILIFIEVAATSFLITLLLIIGLQYHKLMNEDQGYSFRNVLYVKDYVDDPQTRNRIYQELKNIADVKEVSMCSRLPYWGASGNNVIEIGKDKELFNIADLYWVDENYLSVLEIPIIEGKGFIKGETGSNVMMVSESFVDEMARLAGRKDGVTNKDIFITEHGRQTICGVYGDINLWSNGFEKDIRPSVMFYDPSNNYPYVFLLKMHRISPGIIGEINNVFEKFVPDLNITVCSYEEEFWDGFYMMRVFRSGVLICSIVTLLIALIGLIGYLNDETNRRRSEIAIRKINGATVANIQNLFIKNILILTVPAIITGLVASIVTANILQKNMIDKVHISIAIYVLCIVCIASIIIAVVSINSYRASVRNPMENISKE